MQIWECANGNPNQQWEYGFTGAIQWSGTNFCLTLADGLVRTMVARRVRVLMRFPTASNRKLWQQQSESDLESCSGRSLSSRSVSAFPLVPCKCSPNMQPRNTSPVRDQQRSLCVLFPLGSFLAQFHAVSANRNEGPCISVENLVDGAPVVINDCVGPAMRTRTWFVAQGSSATGAGPVGQIQAFNKTFCLDVKDGINADGTKLQIWTCANGNRNQLWQVNGDNTINWAGSNK